MYGNYRPAYGFNQNAYFRNVGMCHITFTSANFQNYQNEIQPSNSIYLLKESNKFNIFELMPKTFKITTNSGSSLFNVELIKGTSRVINEFLNDNPKHFQYNLEIDDNDNVLGKIEQMFQGNLVFFKESDLPTYFKIIQILQITCFPKYDKQPIGFGKQYIDNISNGAKINMGSFEYYLKNEAPRTFNISSKKGVFQCNKFGILSSKILCEQISKDATIDKYEYNCDDKIDEFQLICDLFNFQIVKVTPKNMNFLKEIAEELQITSILDDLNKIITYYNTLSDEIDDQESIVDSIDELLDLLINIKEKTVKSVSDSIIGSNWSKTEENVQELASFIIQVINTNTLLHPYLIDLLEQLDQNANESNNLKILLPFIVDHLMFMFSQSNSNCSFIYLLYKKGFISIEVIIKKIKEQDFYNQLKYDYIYSWFLPELIENHVFNESYCLNQNQPMFKSYSNLNPQNKMNTVVQNNWNAQNVFSFQNNISNYANRFINPNIPRTNNEVTNFNQFIKLFYPNNIEAYKKMRDEREPYDELTKSLRCDDVDTLQSILSRKEDDYTKKTVPYNIFEDFVPNGKSRYIDYAAAYGSVKCFKFLLLNHHEVNDETFRMAVFGGNTEIIQTIDKNKVNNNGPMINNNYYGIGPYGNIIISSIIKNENKIFDWIIENKITDQDKNECSLLYLMIQAILCGNAHAIIGIIDCGLDMSDSKPLIQLASQNGFYKIALLLFNLTAKQKETKPSIKTAGNMQNAFQKKSPNKYQNFINLVQPSIENFVFYGNFDIFKLGIKMFPSSDYEKALLCSVKQNYIKFINYFFDELAKDKKIITLNGITDSLSYSVSQPSCKLFDHLMIKYKEVNESIFSQFKSYKKILITACNKSNFEAVKRLVKLVLEINPKEDFIIPFVTAASAKSTEICKYIIDQNLMLNYDNLSINYFDLGTTTKELFVLVVDKANPYLKDSFLLASISSAIQKGNIELVEYLLSQKVPIDDTLILAVNSRNIEMVNLILKFNSEPWFVNRSSENDPNSPLLMAITNGDIHIIKRLLEVPGINLPSFQESGNENMFSSYLLQENNLDVIKVCIDSRNNIIDDNILIQAINISDEEFSKQLLTCSDKININIQNSQGQTALTNAVIKNYLSIIDILINDKKFDPELSRLNLAFYLSILCNSNQALSHLITAKNLDVNYINFQYNNRYNNNNNIELYDTPLIQATNRDNFEAIELITSHPSFNKVKSRIDLAIFYSARKNNSQIFNKLMELSQFDINELHYRSTSLYSCAVSNKSTEIINELLNNPQFKANELDIQNTFMNIFSFKKNEIIPLLKTVCNYCKRNEGLFDFSKTLPNGKSLFTLIGSSKLNIPNIEEVINLLVENGANPNKPDEFGVYPLENAIKIGYHELVVALLNINKIDYNQKIPTTKNKFVSNAPDVQTGPNYYNQSGWVNNLNQNAWVNNLNQNAWVNNLNQNAWVNNLNQMNDDSEDDDNNEDEDNNNEDDNNEDYNNNNNENNNANVKYGTGFLNTTSWKTSQPKYSYKSKFNTGFNASISNADENNEYDYNEEEDNNEAEKGNTFNVGPSWNKLNYPYKNNWNQISKFGPGYNINKNIGHTAKKNHKIKDDAKFKTYLHLAAVSSNLILNEFINRKLIDINVTDDQGNTPLIDACKMKRRKNIETILNIDNVDFLHRNNAGQDALHQVKTGVTKNEKSKDNDEEIKDKGKYLEKIISYLNTKKKKSDSTNNQFNKTNYFDPGNKYANYGNIHPEIGMENDYIEDVNIITEILQSSTPEQIAELKKAALSIVSGEIIEDTKKDDAEQPKQQMKNAFVEQPKQQMKNSFVEQPKQQMKNSFVEQPKQQMKNAFVEQPKQQMKNAFVDQPKQQMKNAFVDQPKQQMKNSFVDQPKQQMKNSFVEQPKQQMKNSFIEQPKQQMKNAFVEQPKQQIMRNKGEEEKEFDKKEEHISTLPNIRPKSGFSFGFAKPSQNSQTEPMIEVHKSKEERKAERRKAFNLDLDDLIEDDYDDFSKSNIQDGIMQQEWQNIMKMNYTRQVNFGEQIKLNANMIQGMQNQISKKKKKRSHKK